MELEIRVIPSKNVYNDGLPSLLAVCLSGWLRRNKYSELTLLTSDILLGFYYPTRASGEVFCGYGPY